MDIFGVLTLVGGLALFLYGMETMSSALSKASGGRLEKILEKLTSNKLKGVLLGALVTAVIQSSSATTVMVVGFVNSGIMRLSQAVGVIMGANIGTTATSWILSLASLEGDSLLVQLLKPTTFTPVLAAVGVVIILFSKKDKQKDWAQILLGFAVLMFGMETMSTAVEPLASDPAFMQLFTMFQNPLLGLAAGAVLTAVIQSSSASVGILQALAATGAVSWSAAVPIIMGQNIGTCVTALLSSVGAQRNAKRAALVHLYFNVIGTAIFMAAFYSLNALVQFPFMGQAVNAAGIAVVHTVFNVFATLILLPFSKVLEKLACLTVPPTQAEKAAGRIGAVGLSSHNPVVAHMAARTGLIDVLMFSVNPCYDLLPPSDDVDTLWADESYARELHNIDPERQRLYEFCEREGIAIDVMKAYGGGDLLSDANSPFGRPMTPVQCLEYALTRPGVAAVMAGCRSRAEIEAALAWCSATAAERDYTGALAGLDKFSWEGHCMYCGHCAPCSVGIDIAGVNKYYNLTLAQHEIPETVREHYRLLPHHASECIACGRCERNCPFGVDIIGHMRLAAAKFGY